LLFLKFRKIISIEGGVLDPIKYMHAYVHTYIPDKDDELSRQPVWYM